MCCHNPPLYFNLLFVIILLPKVFIKRSNVRQSGVPCRKPLGESQVNQIAKN